MNVIQLPSFEFADAGVMVSEEHWAEIMRETPPEEAFKLQQHAIKCLNNEPKWGIFVSISERILRERDIRYNGPGDPLAGS
jgi:hypothetical protein